MYHKLHSLRFIFFILLVPFLFIPLADAQLLNNPGFLTQIWIPVEQDLYEVNFITNFDLTGYEFDPAENKLTFFVTKNLEISIAEVTIPRELLGEELVFYINDQEFLPNVRSNNRDFFIIMNFTDIKEKNEIVVIGTDPVRVTEHLKEDETIVSTDVESEMDIPHERVEEFVNETIVSTDVESEMDKDDMGGGCLIATATFGSEISSQVQQLREVRHKVIQTESGRVFINTFNSIYYLFSPAVSDYERQNPIFKDIVKVLITPTIYTLSFLNHVEMDSEGQVLMYGLSALAIVIGLHLAPIITVVVYLQKIKDHRQLHTSK